MILSKRVSLNGAQLDELDERIVITGIDEAAGKDSISAVGMAEGDGQRITNMKRESLDVTVHFRLLIRKEDLSARSALLETVNGWASNGGWLRLNYKPGRRILVALSQAPGGGDQWNWTNEFSIVFRAYSVPYWEDENETIAVSSVLSGGAVYLTVPGNTKTVLSLEAANKSGMDINNLRIVTGGQQIQYAGLALRGNQTLTIDYVQTQKLFVLRNRIGSTSVMAARMSISDDEFIVSPGRINVQWAADRAIQLTVRCRGRYL